MPKPLFILLRHAPTVDDRRGVLTAPHDEPRLLPLNRPALARVAAAIGSVTRETGRALRISASPAARSTVTASGVADALGKGTSVGVDPRLSNIDQGTMAGATQDDFRRSPLYWRWHHHPDSVRFSGGESLHGVSQRVDDFIAEHCATEPHVELVVSHTTPLQVMAASLLGLDRGLLWTFYFAYYRVTVIYGAHLVASNSLGEIGTWIPQLRE